MTAPLEAGQLVRRFGIGDRDGGFTAIIGGRSHRLWRWDTATGRYAVKVFDTSVDHLATPDWRDRLSAAAEYECAVYTAGLRIPRPIPLADGTGFLADLTGPAQGSTVRVHEWVEARPVPDTTTDPALAGHIGDMLAVLHRMAPDAPDTGSGLWQTLSGEDISTLVALALRHGRPWAAALDRAHAAFRIVRELANERADRDWPLITAHRDISPKNVLLDDDNRPIVVDWDVVGTWTAAEELAAAAMEFAGVLVGAPERSAVRALVSSYRSAGGEVVGDSREVFAGWLVKHANWTAMHVRRALDEELPATPRRHADRAVPALLDQLDRFTAGARSWASWLN